jgi:fructose PTS system EIIBC or EIIC component
MKTLLMIDSSLGQARSHLAKNLLAAAAVKAGHQVVEQAADAEVVIVAGETVPNDAALAGKNIYTGDVADAVRDPQAFLQRALTEAKPYVAPVATAVTAPAAGGPKRIVAITACPTGVAHTFMAAEAIESEAKKRGSGEICR